MRYIILALGISGLLAAACLGRQDSTSQKGEIAVPGKEALALQAAMTEFQKHDRGTTRQKDLSHYTFTITSNNNYYLVDFNPNYVPKDNKWDNDWITPDGFYETFVIDRKTLRFVRTEVVG